MSDANTQGVAPAVSVVVPVRNEAGNVAPLVAEIAAALAGRAFEIVYVNDGSTDGTEAELIALMRERPYLRQIKHKVSCGQSSAVRSGVAASRAPVCVTLDGDGQNDPKFLPAMFDGLHRFLPALIRRDGFDVVYVDVVDRERRHGVSNYGMWDRLWVGILDLAGVWWLLRRRKRVPQVSEVF